MPREIINFISSTWFDWKPQKLINCLPGSLFKLLCENTSTGEKTLLFKLPKYTKYKKSIFSNFNEEIYILDGSLEFSGNILNKDFYTYVPIGYEKKLFSSKNGSLGIIFLNKKSEKLKKINNFYPNFDHKSWVPRINAFEKIWSTVSNNLKSIDLYNSGARVKILREDLKNGAITFLLGFPPLWSIPEVKNQGGDIEIFLINGIVNSSRGLMKPGSYLSIPNGNKISSMYSKEASVFLFKSHNFLKLSIVKNNKNFNFKDIVKNNDSIIPKKILNEIISGPYRDKI